MNCQLCSAFEWMTRSDESSPSQILHVEFQVIVSSLKTYGKVTVVQRSRLTGGAKNFGVVLEDTVQIHLELKNGMLVRTTHQFFRKTITTKAMSFYPLYTLLLCTFVSAQFFGTIPSQFNSFVFTDFTCNNSETE